MFWKDEYHYNDYLFFSAILIIRYRVDKYQNNYQHILVLIACLLKNPKPV